MGLYGVFVGNILPYIGGTVSGALIDFGLDKRNPWYVQCWVQNRMN